MTRREFLALAGGAAALAAATGAATGAEARTKPRTLAAAPPPGFTAFMIDVGGMPVHTMASADPPAGAPVVVLVHGMALSARYMMPTAMALAPDFHVLAPDLPGFGDSGKPSRALDVPLLADALVAWMDAIGLERAAMLGNSFGCQIIADAAARHPDRVSRGVLQGPTTPPDERSWLWQYVRWQQNAPFNPPEMGEIAGSDYAKCGLVRALMTLDYSLRDRIEDKLPRITAPMLVVRGQLDPICGQSWAERVARDLPDGRLVVLPAVAHTLVFTRPAMLAAASRDFLLNT